MIELMSPTDDIFDSGAEALVCPVNCVGVMGKGLAKEFKERFPDITHSYQYWCTVTKSLRIGNCKAWRKELGQIIILFPTKNHWRDASRIEYVQSALTSLLEKAHDWRLTSIAIPAIGCGLGGLDWSDVLPLIEEAFKDLPDVRVMLYPPKEER